MQIKKRLILGAAVGTTVFGSVFGLAAGLDVTSGEKLGSGNGAVTSCDLDGVTTNYVYDNASGNVTAINVLGISNDCDDAVAFVRGSITGSATVVAYTDGQDENSVQIDITDVAAASVTTFTVTLEGGKPADSALNPA
jgi:hypothetical protein